MGDTTSVTILRALAAAVRAAGADADRFLERAGVDASTLAEDDARVPLRTAVRAWEAAAEVSGDPAFGLRFPSRVPRGTMSVYEYVLRSSESVGAALDRMVRYQRLVHEAVSVHVEERGDELWLAHRLSAPGLASPRHAVEAAVAGWIVQIRSLTGREIDPILVCFRHQAPSDVSEHRRLFRAPIRFGAAENALALPRAVLDWPTVSADPALGAILERHANAALSQLKDDERAASRVRRALADELRGGEPTLALVAKKLRVHERALQRQLAEEGVTFRTLLDELRRDLSARYLAEPGTSIAEVSFLLGFSEPSAFHRAFRRWYGHTPAEHRPPDR